MDLSFGGRYSTNYNFLLKIGDHNKEGKKCNKLWVYIMLKICNVTAKEKTFDKEGNFWNTAREVLIV
jgi:hypothetical protein